MSRSIIDTPGESNVFTATTGSAGAPILSLSILSANSGVEISKNINSYITSNLKCHSCLSVCLSECVCIMYILNGK